MVSDSIDIQLEDLPYDILLNILTHLNFKDLLTLSQVNHKLNIIANDNVLWKLKLLKDIHRWKLIDSKTWPNNLFISSRFNKKTTIQHTTNDVHTTEELSYKQIYLNICPVITTSKNIIKNIKSFQQIQTAMHATSTSEALTSNTNSLTLSSLSSFAIPIMVIGQIKDFVYRNVFRNDQFQYTDPTGENIPKLVLFGPGLETSASCLVKNILWKSEFKTVGMIPGKDGYGAGIKLKLFNHKPFNLTILYSNNSKTRNGNTERNPNENRLLLDTTDSNGEKIYQLNPKVKEACSDAHGFVYVIDNDNLSSLNASSSKENIVILNENHKTELRMLMQETKNTKPLLILSLQVDDLTVSSEEEQKKTMSCVDIIDILELGGLEHDWQLRNCQIFQPNMKDITLGFEWVLNELDQRFANQEQINSDEI